MTAESAPQRANLCLPHAQDLKRRESAGSLHVAGKGGRQRTKGPSLQRLLNSAPRWPLYICGAIPGIWIFWLALNDQLGADPVKSLEHQLGIWTLRFIVAGLAVTPLRRLGGPNLIRFRRALGLLAFFYALAHLLSYIVFDRGLNGAEILADIFKRPYITFGMVAFAILVPLAATSNAAMIRRLGAAAWQKLHRWIYVAAIAAVVHFILSVKSWPLEPLIYAALVAALLLIRIGLAARRRLPSRRPV